MENLSQLIAEVSMVWVSARALGLAAWLASSATVAMGLLVTGPRLHRGPSPSFHVVVHRAVAMATVIAAALHVAFLLVDPYAQLTLLDVFVPGLAARMPLATALGTIAFVLLLVVTIASLARMSLSSRVWRVVHTAAFAVWPLATAHYVMEGTDAMRWWSIAAIIVVFILLSSLLIRRGWARAVEAGWIRVAGRQARSAPDSGSGPAPVAPTDSIEPTELTVVSIRQAGGQSATIEFERPDTYHYAPGQFLTLEVPAPGGDVARCYSLSSAPHEDTLTITVKKVEDGAASPWLVEQLRLGMRLRTLPPSGRFVLPQRPTQLALFAAGSGITPLYSMIKSALAQSEAQITLFYANASTATAIFSRELTGLSDQHSDRFRLRFWDESVQGRPSVGDIAAVLGDQPAAEVFVCGPQGFMDLVVSTAREAGWPEQAIHSEQFVSMAINPFTSLGSPIGQTDDGEVPVLQARVQGEDFVVPWHPQKTMIEALLSAGVQAPRSCLAGRCATCLCTVISGEVETREDTASEAQIAQAQVLSCQTRPASDHISVSY